MMSRETLVVSKINAIFSGSHLDYQGTATSLLGSSLFSLLLVEWVWLLLTELALAILRRTNGLQQWLSISSGKSLLRVLLRYIKTFNSLFDLWYCILGWPPCCFHCPYQATASLGPRPCGCWWRNSNSLFWPRRSRNK